MSGFITLAGYGLAGYGLYRGLDWLYRVWASGGMNKL